MNAQRISQRDIAAKANVHHSTVSLALSNSPILPEETRHRIQKLAEEMGYRPDPMLSALQAYRKTQKSSGYEGTIAWINTWKPPGELYCSKYGEPAVFVQLYNEGAKERCEQLGYRLEEFRLSEMSAARLSKIFQARNIQGLLLPPQQRDRAHLKFDWENYSAVAFGSTLSLPRLHSVANAQYGTARLGVRSLRKLGYRRIGFVTTHAINERTDQTFTYGYLAAQERNKPSDQVPLLILSDKITRAQQTRVFNQWYKKHRPTAILTSYPTISYFMEELKIPYSQCGYAQLNLDPHKEGRFAGVDQNERLIGTAAVDFLVGMLHRNERGVPETPFRLLVEGKWVEGKTVYRQNVGKTAKKLSAK